MPKLDPKTIQKELDSGKLWPVYWIYGEERMKVRELVKRIKNLAVGESLGFSEDHLDGSESSAESILDAAQMMNLGGGTRLVIIRDAHLIKESEKLSILFGPCGPKQDVPSVCVFISKDLDGRKKFSKQLIEKAAVVPCEEIAEQEREAWIQYLAKKKGVALNSELALHLCALDPWNLDIIDQELEKFELSSQNSEVFLDASASQKQGEIFLDALFRKDLKAASQTVLEIADSPDIALPLLGLITWNVRQLALILAGQKPKLGPMILDRLTRWSRNWTLSEIVQLQHALFELDFELKQTPRLALGSWSSVVFNSCQSTKPEAATF